MKTDEVIFRQRFEALFREHFTGLSYFARKYTGDLDSAKEIVHTVFLRIWENRHNFDWENPAKSYLFTSVYNRSMNYLRDRRKFTENHNIDVLSQSEPLVCNDSPDAEELEKQIQAAIDKLPQKCREVFELSRFSEKKYAEIAVHLGISVKTVEAHMSKALHLLKQELKDYLYLLLLVIIKNMYNW